MQTTSEATAPLRGATSRAGRIALAALWLVVASGCGGVAVEPLMPTPVVYAHTGIEPLAHIPREERWVARRVYFATTRARTSNLREIAYGDRVAGEVALGLALVGFGGPDMTWADLRRHSTAAKRDEVVDLTIAGIIEAGRYRPEAPIAESASAEHAGWILEDMGDAIDDARDPDVLIYVHGARVDFYNACAFAAQLDHFMGRDMTSIAYAWPSRRSIAALVLGGDLERAHAAAPGLASLIELIASETRARRIHLLSWSAGSRVVTEALEVLRARYPDRSVEELRERFRIGTAYFAAGEIPTAAFVAALPAVHGLSDRVVVTVTAHDEALKAAKVFIRGGSRIGQLSPLSAEQVEVLERMDRLEVVDVSRGHEERGFDIAGHYYWFAHPWASTDALLAVRSDLPAAERGLVSAGHPLLWMLPPDYPDRLVQTLEGVELRRD